MTSIYITIKNKIAASYRSTTAPTQEVVNLRLWLFAAKLQRLYLRFGFNALTTVYLQVGYLVFALMYRLIISALNSKLNVHLFVGVVKVKLFNKDKNRRGKRRKRRQAVRRPPSPYFFSKLLKVPVTSSVAQTIYSYKMLWSNNDTFSTTSSTLYKLHSVFSTKYRLLSHIVRRSTYRYGSNKRIIYGYNSDKLNTIVTDRLAFKGETAPLTAALLSWKSAKLKKVLKARSRPIFFRKRIVRSLIDSRALLKFVFKIKRNSRRRFVQTVNALTHSTLKARLTALELSAFNVLLRSGLTNSFRDSLTWIKRGYVFINGVSFRNPYRQLSVSDRIQLPITNRYFLYKRSRTVRAIRDISKLKSKIFYKNRGSFNLFRLKSRLWPNWVLRTAYFGSRVPAFLEVDYLSMTIVVLLLPTHLLEYDSPLWRYINLSNYRLYNWKLIN